MAEASEALDTAAAEGKVTSAISCAIELLALCNAHLAPHHAFTCGVRSRLARCYYAEADHHSNQHNSEHNAEQAREQGALAAASIRAIHSTSTDAGNRSGTRSRSVRTGPNASEATTGAGRIMELWASLAAPHLLTETQNAEILAVFGVDVAASVL